MQSTQNGTLPASNDNTCLYHDGYCQVLLVEVVCRRRGGAGRLNLNNHPLPSAMGGLLCPTLLKKSTKNRHLRMCHSNTPSKNLQFIHIVICCEITFARTLPKLPPPAPPICYVSKWVAVVVVVAGEEVIGGRFSFLDALASLRPVLESG